jgi:hypothetical protein
VSDAALQWLADNNVIEPEQRALGWNKLTIRSPLENRETRYMGINGSTTQRALVRDEQGRWVKGFPGGPGRPLGSRNKLSEDFLSDIHTAWLQRGAEVIDRLITERPEIFLLAMLKITQPSRVEVSRPEDFDRPSSREEAFRRLEQSAGPKARKMLEDFLARVAKLEADQER